MFSPQNADLFKSYSKLENHYRSEFLQKIREKDAKLRELNQPVEWIASEKVHGSNFSFIVHSNNNNQTEASQTANSSDQLQITISNRTTVLDKNFTNFYPEAIEEVWQRYENSAKKLFVLIAEEAPSWFVNNLSSMPEENESTDSENVATSSQSSKEYILKKIHIYGELFGGCFPKHKVTNNEDSTKRKHIQKGVYYCPHYDFYVFDVFCSFENGEEKWAVFDHVDPLLEKADFRVRAKPLIRGTLEECLSFDIEFNTTLPHLYYSEILDELNIHWKEKENLCEGVVIKAANRNVHVGARAIIKKKNSKFLETNPAKTKNRQPKKDRSKEVSEDYENTWQEMERYITMNRLSNVESKIGTITRHNLSQIMKEFVSDIICDYNKDVTSEVNTDDETTDKCCKPLDQLDEADQKKITKKLSETCMSLVKRYVNMHNSNKQ
ncbi:hypothetical protein FDP41_002852 [Naegleria fowleri]|uniref:RNA ligase domain-containing protein n=1 Tax=Naegleria fowleri TaxID=5763 RepID=A0A6A5BMS6_NAEFO|nr:uncharacterized protein FDP41_002852 [Naegleria fowleri]KAF0978337.1 hypothetical protein FDP41_002852 [Naegleria fowleri]